MIQPGILSNTLIRRIEDNEITVANFKELQEEFSSIDLDHDDLRLNLSLIVLCLTHFKKVSQKNLALILNHYKEQEDTSWTDWFELDIESDEESSVFDQLNKKTIYSFYNKKITKNLRDQLKYFTENHFETMKTTKQSERVGLKFLYATINGTDRRIAPAKLHYRGFADVSQSKKSGKASSRLAKTIFR